MLAVSLKARDASGWSASAETQICHVIRHPSETTATEPGGTTMRTGAEVRCGGRWLFSLTTVCYRCNNSWQLFAKSVLCLNSKGLQNSIGRLIGRHIVGKKHCGLGRHLKRSCEYCILNVIKIITSFFSSNDQCLHVFHYITCHHQNHALNFSYVF